MNANKDYLKLSEQQSRQFMNLKQWLYEKNAKYDHLEVVNFKSGYRGVISNKSIEKKQRIIFIPRDRLITLQLAKADPICLQIIKNKTQLISPKHTFLAIYLLQESNKQNESVWKHYINLLPKEHHIFPINYTKEQLMQLTGSLFLFQIHQRVFDLKKDYDKIFIQVVEFRKYTFFDFCWARTMVGSRMFGVHIDGLKTNILAPFADMLNHKLPKQTSWNFLQQQQGFCIQSLGQISQGVEIYDSYGKKCNTRYLLNYGFVIQNNEMNQICLKINFDDDPFKHKKFEMLKKIDGFKILKISVNMNENNFYEAMGYLRFQSISEFNQLAVLQKISGIKITNDPYLPAKTPPMTIQLQLATWKLLKKICQCSLKQYNTTIQEDLKLLQSQTLTYNIRNIIILRLGQKRLYKFYIQTSSKAIDVLSKDYVDCFQDIVKKKQEGWAKYIFKMLCIMPHQKKKQVSHLLVQQKQQIEGPKSQQQLQDL